MICFALILLLVIVPGCRESKDIFDAAKNVNIMDMRFFIEKKGEDVNTKDNMGWTPLHYAVGEDCDIDFLKYMIEKGADVNAKTIDGTTPLHHAVRDNTNLDVLKYLVENGADVNAQRKDGETPLDYIINGPIFRDKVLETVKEREAIIREEGGKSGSAL
jgi:ankyrin repeat protein